MADQTWTLPHDRLAARRHELMNLTQQDLGRGHATPRRGLRAAVVAGAAALALGVLVPVGPGASGPAQRVRTVVNDSIGLLASGAVRPAVVREAASVGF